MCFLNLWLQIAGCMIVVIWCCHVCRYMRTAAATAAHTRYLSSPAATTSHGLVLRLPPQHKPHATFMQPLECVLQHHVANLHVATHMATQMTTIMWPFQCDLQPQIQETQRTMHTGAPPRCRTQRRNQFADEKRPQPQPPHTRGTFHRRLQPLYTKKQKVWCPGFLHNKLHATFMQPLQCVLQHHVANPHVSTHMATRGDNNHTAITRVSCYVMPSLTPQSHTTLHWVYSYVM